MLLFDFYFVFRYLTYYVCLFYPMSTAANTPTSISGGHTHRARERRYDVRITISKLQTE